MRARATSRRPPSRIDAAFDDLDLRGARVLFVASTGGHLSEIERVARAVGASPESALVTFPAAQSSSVSWIDDVRYVPYVKPRDFAGAARAAKLIRRMLRDEQWDAVVSTGAAVAVSALPVALAMNIRSIYVESFARFTGPSATGRILERLPRRIELYTQHHSWAAERWQFSGSILDTLQTNARHTSTTPNRVFVTLGTISPYRFDALIDSVLKAAPPDTEFVWQLGCTSRQDLPGTTFEHMLQAEFDAVAGQADLVISHAGVGTAIGLIELGHKPVLIPRRVGRGEHVDDHQIEIAEALTARGLARTYDAAVLDKLVFAASAA
jgi:UDP-N-acetylglucosamine--N-acetylmuramyl-(pentapeptide) pyrophosphoryl-undecaprenol N-acetylglucosamine transferase